MALLLDHSGASVCGTDGGRAGGADDNDSDVRREAGPGEAAFQCYLCRVGVQGTFVDHLVACSSIPLAVLERVFVEDGTPDDAVARIDAQIAALQALRQAVVRRNRRAAAAAAAVPRDQVAIPPCPDYASMPVAELRKRMAAYGFRNGSKSYMVSELTAAWDAVHINQAAAAPSRPARAPVTATTSRAHSRPDASQIEPFRSPPSEGRTRKVRPAVQQDASSDAVDKGDGHADAILEFISTNERLLDHVLCMKSVDVGELYAALKKADVAVPFKAVSDFCRAQGFNVVDRWRQ